MARSTATELPSNERENNGANDDFAACLDETQPKSSPTTYRRFTATGKSSHSGHNHIDLQEDLPSLLCKTVWRRNPIYYYPNEPSLNAANL
jgi:hypothetical protein